MIQLWKNDEYCRRIIRKMRAERELKKIFILDNGILYRLWLEDGQTYKCMVVPVILRDPLLVQGHNWNGHNGSRRMYNTLKRSYYGPNMKKEVFFHCKNCSECILQNQTTTDTGWSFVLYWYQLSLVMAPVLLGGFSSLFYI